MTCSVSLISASALKPQISDFSTQHSTQSPSLYFTVYSNSVWLCLQTSPFPDSDKRGGFCQLESLTSLPNGVRPNPLYGKNPFLDGASTPQFQIGLLINSRL